jgi:hypothetical protein
MEPGPEEAKDDEGKGKDKDGGKGKEKGAKPAKASLLKSKLLSLSSKDKKVSSFPFFPSVYPSFLHFGLISSLLSFLPFVIGSLIPSFLEYSFLPSCLPSFLPSFL